MWAGVACYTGRVVLGRPCPRYAGYLVAGLVGRRPVRDAGYVRLELIAVTPPKYDHAFNLP